MMTTMAGMLDQIRARVRLKHAAALILAAAVIGFLRAHRLVSASDAINANPDVRTGLLWMMRLYCLTVGCLAVGLWYWGRELAWERAGSFRLRHHLCRRLRSSGGGYAAGHATANA